MSERWIDVASGGTPVRKNKKRTAENTQSARLAPVPASLPRPIPPLRRMVPCCNTTEGGGRGCSPPHTCTCNAASRGREGVISRLRPKGPWPGPGTRAHPAPRCLRTQSTGSRLAPGPGVNQLYKILALMSAPGKGSYPPDAKMQRVASKGI
jgi:hypothetical protein